MNARSKHRPNTVASHDGLGADGMRGTWDNARTLQIDSYATGRQMATAHVINGEIWIEVTDGYKTWRGKLQPPKGWNP